MLIMVRFPEKKKKKKKREILVWNFVHFYKKEQFGHLFKHSTKLEVHVFVTVNIFSVIDQFSSELLHFYSLRAGLHLGPFLSHFRF